MSQWQQLAMQVMREHNFYNTLNDKTHPIYSPRMEVPIHIEPNEDEIENINVEHENSEHKNGNGKVVIIEMKLVKMKP